MSRTPAEFRAAMDAMSPFLQPYHNIRCSPGQPCKEQWANPDGTGMSFSVRKYEGQSVAIAVQPKGADSFCVVVAEGCCRIGVPLCNAHRAAWDEMTAAGDSAVDALRNR